MKSLAFLSYSGLHMCCAPWRKVAKQPGADPMQRC
jgi:hypothetical protein